MTTFLMVIYCLTVFLCLSTYVFYPAVIWILGRIAPFKTKKGAIVPRVSIIIAAYNEARDITEKLRNTLALDYPKEMVEILVGSDGSTDETAELVRGFSIQGVQLFEFTENRGKSAVQNDLVAEATGEILVFTDAASFLPRDAVSKLVRGFADERVGCIAGRMVYTNTGENITTQSQGLYWRYEANLRRMESDLGRLIGVDGPLYALRRKSYRPVGENIISDFITPLLVLREGKKAILEPDALVEEAPTRQSTQEFATRRRITLRGLVGLSVHSSLLNPLKTPFLAFQITFHKVIRWFVGPLVVINCLALCLLIADGRMGSLLVPYLAFALAAIAGWLLDRAGIRCRALTVAYYFILVNLAATMGIIDFFKRRQAIAWRPIRN